MHYLPKTAAGEYSVVVSNVSGVATSAVANLNFTAYTNALLRLRAEHSPDPGLFQFSLTGESGRAYRVEVSDNLINWRDEPTLAQTVQNADTTSVYSFEI